ncbi:hypothetical protein B0J13DRAFT_578421 [Dactylonectria estremocensis]|uniref:Rhodopsin domain-containing protein n=1 Tax=Dactylonectria estremocensis TaxID=1079267 RepID=A0A9P9I6T9_9HYPO|nr:hypothetical protein B0J13DRAFT_578421 [Dactylonectria estremocensis]
MAQFNPNVAVSVFVTMVAAALALTGRLVARRMTKVVLWLDDYFAISAFVFACSWSAVMVAWTLHAGLGIPLDDVEGKSPEQALRQSHLFLWNAELFYALSLALSKISILGFYWRLFSKSNIRLPIQILATCSLVWLIIRTFLAIFHCVPVQAFWDKTIEGAMCSINDSKFFFGTVLVHLIIDVFILVLPVLQVKRLQLRSAQKAAVISLFMFGTLVCVASIVVLVESLKFDPSSPEMPSDIASIMIWATVEVNLAIVSSCLPILRPILSKIAPRSMPMSGRDNQQRHCGQGEGIDLRRVTTHKEVDDSSSTRRLADLEQFGCCQDDYVVMDGRRGPQTVISARRDETLVGKQVEGERGIQVTNQMTVQIERTSSDYS